MNKTGKKSVIYQEISQRIHSGIYAQGLRLPTESSLCSEFSASRPTVSRALARLREDGLISSVQGSGHYVTARDKSPAELITAPESFTFGILSPRMEENESGFIFEKIFKCIASLSQSLDFDLVWNGVMTLGAGASRFAVMTKVDGILNRYLNSNINGVFFIPIEFHPYAFEINMMIVNKLNKHGISIVLLDSDITPWPTRSHCDLIGIDNLAAGLEVTRFLIRNQPRRIDFVCEHFSANTVNIRKMGYRLALIEAGVMPQNAWEHEGNLNDGQFIKMLLESGAQDIVCANDFTAMKLLSACAKNNHKINVVGFDDNQYSALLSIPLTTYKQPFDDIARNAVFTMLNRVKYPADNARYVQIHGELIIRESCQWRD